MHLNGNKRQASSVTRKQTGVEIAAKSFASKKAKTNRLGTGRMAEDYYNLYQHDLINDCLREFLAELETNTHQNGVKIEEVSKQTSNSPHKENSQEKIAKNFKISKKVNPFMKAKLDSFAHSPRKTSYDYDEPTSSKVQNHIIQSLLRRKPPNEEVDKPLQEHKAELERRQKALARLKAKRAKKRLLLLNNEVPDLSIDPNRESETIDAALKNSIDSPARFHPKPLDDDKSIDTPLVKSKKSRKGEPANYFVSKNKLSASQRQVNASSLEEDTDSKE